MDAHALIAGAGPAGLMTALTLAKKGLKVLVVEKRAKDRLGKTIRVSVEKDIFTQLSLPPPEPPELLAPPLARELISPDGRSRIKLRSAPLITVSLPLLVTRLVALAEAAGVEFLCETAVTGPKVEDGRVTGLVGSSADGRLLNLSAPLAIDASGIAGVLRHNLDPDSGVTRELDPGDVATAWQETRELDRAEVMDLLERNRIRPQVNVIRLGFRGPFSMLSIYVNLDEDQVEVTAGLRHDPAAPSARELVEGYTDSHSWIKAPIARGGGLIPVRRPLDNFVAPGFACVGDAACQAIPLHASGVASALAGGMILGEVAAAALEDGEATTATLWPYNRRYMTARGAAQANSDLLRRFLMDLSADQISELFARRLFSEEAVTGSLEGLALEIPPSALLQAALPLWKRPALLYRLFRLSRTSSRIFNLYAQYPEQYDPLAFDQWQLNIQKLFSAWS
jgi:digeranylgeranylglycerophospholipid reductase